MSDSKQDADYDAAYEEALDRLRRKKAGVRPKGWQPYVRKAVRLAAAKKECDEINAKRDAIRAAGGHPDAPENTPDA